MFFLDSFSLESDGPTLTIRVKAGNVVAIVGPTRSGKTRFIRGLLGKERPPQGTATLSGTAILVGDPPVGRRTKVQNLGRQGAAPDRLSQAMELLLAFRLHDLRKESFSDLSPSEQASAELLEAISSSPTILAIDGQLDRLDPWALRGAMEQLRRITGDGTSLVITTHRPDIAAIADIIVVLNHGRLRFAGSREDLLRQGPPHQLTVQTNDNPGVRALVSPFLVDVEDSNGTLTMRAAEGQELAARLLLEGYGDVNFVVSRPPTIEEALLRLL